MKISCVPSHKELRGLVPEVKGHLNANLSKWKFPLTDGGPSSVQTLPGMWNSILYFLRKTAPYYWSALIMTKFWSIFVWGVVACCPLVPPAHQSSSDTSRWPSCHCLLNFSFRLKIETNLLGIKKREKKSTTKDALRLRIRNLLRTFSCSITSIIFPFVYFSSY